MCVEIHYWLPQRTSWYDNHGLESGSEAVDFLLATNQEDLWISQSSEHVEPFMVIFR